MGGVLETEYVTIQAGDDLSDAIDLRSRVLRTVVFPADWSGTDDVAYAVAAEQDGTYLEIDDFGHASEAETAFVVADDAKARLLGWTKLIVTPQGSGDPAILVITFSSYDFSADNLVFDVSIDGGAPVTVTLDTDLVDGDGFTAALADAEVPGIGWVVDGDSVTLTTDSLGDDASIEISDLTDDGPNTDLADGIVTGDGASEPVTVALMTETRD